MDWQTWVISLMMGLLPATVTAETWTSPDGLVTVMAPDADQFVTIQELPPGFIALWISQDESMKFGILRIEVPSHTPRLIQSSVEKGFAEEAGGQVVRLPTRTVSGHEVWNMKATGPAGEFTQAFARHGDVIYKLMAVTPSGNAAPTVRQFMDSLAFTQPDVPVPNPSPRQERQPDPMDDLSRKIGGFGGMLAIALAIYFAMKGKKKTE